jgi:hypothetical protein
MLRFSDDDTRFLELGALYLCSSHPRFCLHTLTRLSDYGRCLDLSDTYTRNYKWLRQSHWVTHSKDNCSYNTRKVFSVSSSRCLVAASSGGRPLTPVSRIALGLSYHLLTSHDCNSQLTQSQSKNYFTTGGSPPNSSSRRQAPWDLRPGIFCNWALAIIVLTLLPLWWKDGFFSYEYSWPFVKRPYRTYSMLLKLFHFAL